MKVGPHSNMNLNEIIKSKIEEEKIHNVHYWGYSGVFCRPKAVQKFIKESIEKFNEVPTLVLIETKSSYKTDKIGFIRSYSIDNIEYKRFDNPVQLQGAEFSFICKNLKQLKNFDLNKYNVVYGKNDGKSIISHLKFRVNKSFATLSSEKREEKLVNVYTAEFVYPYAVWLKDEKN